MESDSWVVQNLVNALNTWNDKLAEIWQIITQSPEEFKGGGIWNVIVDIHGALQAIGYALLVLFFVMGVVKTCGSFTEVKRPEHALKLFVRFAIAKGVIAYGLELMMALFHIVQGIVSTFIGYRFGAETMERLEKTGLMESVMQAASILGLTVAGAMTAEMVYLTVPITIGIGEEATTIQSILDGIIPCLLPLGLFGVVYYLLKKKKVKPLVMMFILMGIGILGAYFGFLE